MPPKVKFQKQDIIDAAFGITRARGIEALTAREVAAELGVSTRPIFTWFDTMDELRAEVHARAMELYRGYLEQGLTEPLPFLGLWRRYIAFAEEEPKLFKLLFLNGPAGGGAAEILRFSCGLARPSVMSFYNLDADSADCFFRDIWLVAFSFATLIVTDDCPYTHDEIFAVGAEISLSVCKAYKEIPGLAKGEYDRDAVFGELVKR